MLPLLFHQVSIRFRPAIPEELPDIPYFLYFIEIQVRHNDFFLVARSFRNDLSARRAEIALAVEFADIPWILAADAIDRTDKITIRNRMSRLLQFQQVFAKAGDGR